MTAVSHPRSVLEKIIGRRPLMTWLLTRCVGVAALLFFRLSDGDIREYFTWARALQAGLTPYRDFLVEYPPGAFAVMVLPAQSLALFETSFLGLALAADFVILRVLRQPTSDGSMGVGIWLVLPLALGPLLWGRLDIFVALFLVLALDRLEGERVAQAGMCISAAALLKLWPAVLLVLLLPLIQRRQRPTWLLASLGFTMAVTGAVLFAGGGGGLARMIHFQGHRGLEVEAVAAVPVHWWVLAGHPVPVVHAHGSFEFPVDTVAPLLVGCEALLAVGLVAILLLTLGRHSPAPVVVLQTCTVFLVFGNVLSPQYLIWTAASLAACANNGPAVGRMGVLWVGLLVLLATQYVFPLFFSDVVTDAPAGVVLLTVRTALLLWFAVRVARLSRRLVSGVPGGRVLPVAIEAVGTAA